MSVERLAGQIRATEEGALPAGEHLMTLDSVAIMQRKKGGFGLRIMSRHQSGAYAMEWRNLSSDVEDALKLTPGQRRGLREFAGRFGIAETDPQKIISALQQSVGSAVRVQIKQTPYKRVVLHSLPTGVRIKTEAGSLTLAGELLERK